VKCAYNYCKLGGEVKKEDAIKDGRYYHKDCYNKKIVKSECRELLLENYKFMNKNVSTAIKQLVDEKDINPERLKFTIEYVIKNNSELNSPYGIGYWLENYDIKKEFDKYVHLKKFNEVKNKDVKIEVVDESKFEFKKGGKKSWEII
jgi:methyl coenzyme M reductase subunit C-like uncharacterized protein (methanogenesis marker protein 7)